MAYGLNRGVLGENAPSGQAHGALTLEPQRSSWQLLSEACRLEVVERALSRAGVGKSPPLAF